MVHAGLNVALSVRRNEGGPQIQAACACTIVIIGRAVAGPSDSSSHSHDPIAIAHSILGPIKPARASLLT